MLVKIHNGVLSILLLCRSSASIICRLIAFLRVAEPICLIFGRMRDFEQALGLDVGLVVDNLSSRRVGRRQLLTGSLQLGLRPVVVGCIWAHCLRTTLRT